MKLHLVRDDLRQIMVDQFPGEAEQRQKRTNPHQHGHLSQEGPGDTYSVDGHEKTGEAALQFGGLGLNVYGAVDMWSTWYPLMLCLPKVREANTIGHFYLDVAEVNHSKSLFHLHIPEFLSRSCSLGTNSRNL